MNQSSQVLRVEIGGNLTFMCPGCRCRHTVSHGYGSGPKWEWNGDTEKPTFTPSIKVSYPAIPDATDDFAEWRTERVCHSFITDGEIQFLSDCTHELAGQTVVLPELE